MIWNKCRSQMTTEETNNNLNILIDPTYRTADDRQSFSQFYLHLVNGKRL